MSGGPRAGSADAPFTLLVTFGTDHHPFSRLSGWLEPWLAAHPGVRCIVQEGYSVPPAGAETVGIVSRAALLDLMRSASAIVGQGGPGTVLDAASCGRVPIVVPRLARHGEVVDDHQVAFCRRMAAEGRALLAESATALHHLLDAAVADPATTRCAPYVPPVLETVATMRGVLHQVLAHRPGFVSWRHVVDLLVARRRRRVDQP